MSSDDYNSASDIDDSTSPVLNALSPPPSPAPTHTGKRNHTDTHTAAVTTKTATVSSSKAADTNDALQQQIEVDKHHKKRQKYAELKQRKHAHHTHDYALRDADITQLKTSGEKAQLYWQLYEYSMKQHNAVLSSIESDDHLTPTHIHTLHTTEPHTLDRLPRALKQMCKDYRTRLCDPVMSETVHGQPYIVYVCSAALRAVDVVRTLFSLGLKKPMVVKLFGKHIKAEEQVQALSTDVRVVVGTPNRIHKLLQNGVLTLDRCEYVMLDMVRDVKHYTVLTMPVVAQDWFLLYQQYIHALLKKKHDAKLQPKLVFY